uniref:Uncharacterized protein n=1 Tax=Oryza glumipatula TaxID=40148 RepID=A0A0D9YTV1_9ORYZ
MTGNILYTQVLILILTALNAVVVIEEIHGNILRVVEKCRMLDGQCVPDPCLPLPRECVVSINNNSMSDEIWRCMARQSCCFWNAMHMDGLTGIAIFFHMLTTYNALLFQATSLVAQSSLQAELLAMEVAKFLNFAGSIFLTDNGTLADTTKKDFDKS